MNKAIKTLILVIAAAALLTGCADAAGGQAEADKTTADQTPQPPEGRVTVKTVSFGLKGFNGIVMRTPDGKDVIMDVGNGKGSNIIVVSTEECEGPVNIRINEKGAVLFNKGVEISFAMWGDDVFTPDREPVDVTFTHSDYDDEIPMQIDEEGFLILPEGTVIDLKCTKGGYTFTVGEELDLLKEDGEWKLDE